VVAWRKSFAATFGGAIILFPDRRSLWMIVRVAVLVALALNLLGGVAQAQMPKTGRKSLSDYQDHVAGKLPKEAKIFDGYMLGVLTAIEMVLANEREQGRKLPFCPPAGKIFSIADLHASIQSEVKDGPNYWEFPVRPDSSVGHVAARSYVRRYPCPVGASQQPVETPVQAEKLTVREFEMLLKQMGPSLNAAGMTLTGFALGLRDGIEGMQFRISAREDDICLPEPAIEASPSIIFIIKQELGRRPDYWADKQDWSVGPAAMVALKRRKLCKR
jgi:hypothetical protein